MIKNIVKTAYENEKAKLKKKVYRITHPIETVKEQVKFAKHLAFGNYDSYPPSAQKVLNQYGNAFVTSIVLHRNPLSKTYTTLMNLWTRGETDKRIAQQPKDQLFHIGMWVTLSNGKVIKIEKNEVINLVVNPTKPKEEQTSQNVPKPPSKLTFGGMLENTRKYVGNHKFFSYSAKNNNCGNFIEMILKANGLNTPATHEYIGQDTKTILGGFPKLRKFMNTITDIGARFNILTDQDNNLPSQKYKPKQTVEEPIETTEPVVENEPIENEFVGDGLKSKQTNKPNKWIMFVKNIQKQRNLSYKEALKVSKDLYKKQI